MPKFQRNNLPKGDYREGYLDGVSDTCDHAELSAYYTGVGYGKKLAGDKNIGFNSRKELEQFEHGIRKKDNHFNSYRAEPLTFWERVAAFFSGEKRTSKNTVKTPNYRWRKKMQRKKARQGRKANKRNRKR